MPSRITRKRIEEFISELEAFGSTAGNKRLREKLDWKEDFYWKVQGHLVEEGTIVPGRGKGGSVRLTRLATSSPAPTTAVSDSVAKERDLYKTIRRTIETTWIKRFGFDEVKVDETHSQGSKATGGKFTRPDITAAGIRRYVFLPPRLEIMTFEVKTKKSVDIMGVLESIAHREAAHRAYVIYALSRSAFDEKDEAERIMELAQKYEI